MSARDAARVAGALRELTGWAAGVRFADLPVPVRERAALILADDLAAIVAGYSDPECARLAAHMLAHGGAPQASVFDGSGARTDCYTAACANAAAGTWCELDEGYRRTFCHAGIYVLPALLAQAETTDATVERVLRALALAYEVVTRIARAFPGTTRALHPHGCFAAVGAAAGVALLRASPGPELATVLDTAAWTINPTPFDQAFRGALSRNVFAAIGAGNGMRAADWAALGVSALDTAPAGVYAGGLGAAIDAAALTAGLGEDWAVLSNFQRRFACCQFGHSTIEATLELRSRLSRDLGVDDLERIVVEIHPLGMHLDSTHPTTTLGARFSMPHITAACTRLGHADVAAFSLERIADPAIASLRERVELVPYEPTPEPPADRPARVTWHLRGGATLHAACASARGEPGRPFTASETMDKVAALADPLYPGLSARAAAVVAQDPQSLARGWRTLLQCPARVPGRR